MNFQERATLTMKNVLSYRAKMTQQELVAKSQEIETILQKTGAKRNASTVTTTYTVEQGPQGPVMDIEVLVPLELDQMEVDIYVGISPNIL